ncbi:hypothetical protein [Marinobacter nauticus]|uniref:hypothetical protein n=1 Tax=Marinobacter nauticus TaxID=2743 RepID=UPI001C992846|nr:hypothetical protein [Marinobacter nauticus]MBY5961938.1 hypothetical protein [Marinobacter nauticus]
MSNEKPILFKDDMIRAILEGRKTQTRRIVPEWQRPSLTHDGDRYISIAQRHPRWGFGVFGKTEDECMANYNDEYASLCPFGKPGDRLWVRETFADEAGGTRKFPGEHIYYRADGDGVDLQGGCWTPSIHMPRWASRITLEVTGVRVERLQDISERDSREEGARFELAEIDSVRLGAEASHRGGFQNLWQRINGPDSWYANPWVWVIKFKRIDQEAKAA